MYEQIVNKVKSILFFIENLKNKTQSGLKFYALKIINYPMN
jgi:hypothetical protein